MLVLNNLIELEERILYRLDRIERIIHMVDHTLDELKAAEDANAARVGDVATDVAKVRDDVTAILAKLAAIPAAGLTPQQQTLVNELVETAQRAGTTLDSSIATLAATDAAANPAPAAPAEPVDPAAAGADTVAGG